jgi:cytochrome P450
MDDAIGMADFGSTNIPPNLGPEYLVDFDVYNPPGVTDDYYAAWKALQKTDGPEIVWTPRNGGHWIALRGRAIKEIWTDYDNFSSRIQMVPKSDGEQNQLLPSFLDPPAYWDYRSLVMRTMSPKRVMAAESTIRSLAVSLIESVRSDGTCDFVKDYAEQLPIRIFLQMCDLPREDAPQLKWMTDRMLRPDPAVPREEVRRYFRDYLAPVIAKRRGGNGEDVLSVYANATIGDRLLSEDEVIEMSTVLLFAGLDTVVNFLSFVMHFLSTNPSHRDRLVKDPQLIHAATEEFVRRFPIVTQARVVTRDQEFGGAKLREGDVVVLPSALHGLDERENEKPLEVDFNRSNGQHSTFGQGAHRCVGLLLAKTEVRITLQEWLSRIPDFRLSPDAKMTFFSGMVGTVGELQLVWETNEA